MHVNVTALLVALWLTLEAGAERAEETALGLLGQMTLEEKMDLMNGLGWQEFDLLPGYFVGNTPPISRLGIPPLNMQDAAQGFRTMDPRQIGQVTSWPSLLAMGATFDVDLMYKWATALSKEFTGKGANVILGPSLNLHRVAKGGRNGEYVSGEDPVLGANMARAYVRGVQESGLLAVAKHFALNNQETNRNTVDVHCDQRTLFEAYYLPFIATVEEGVAAFMCSYNLVNGTHSCENNELLNRHLKDTIGFEGLSSDWWATHSTSAKAGLDQDMPGNDGFFDHEALDQVDEAVLDESVHRILTQMLKVGLMSKTYCTPPSAECDTLLFDTNVRNSQHLSLARKIGRDSGVLLKNDGVLPFDGKRKFNLAVIGSACDAENDINAQLETWDLGSYYTVGGSGRVIAEDPISIIAGLQATIRENSYENVRLLDATVDDLSRAIEAMDAADAILICGATTSTESVDRTALQLDQDEFIRDVLQRKPQTVPAVVAISSPGPVLTDWREDADAILCLFLAGEQTGNAFADLLFGLASPSGKLPVTFIANKEQTVEPCFSDSEPCVYTEGLYIGYKGLHDEVVAFPFGHGLSYTTFDYKFADELDSCSDMMCYDVEIANTGSAAGAEVVQLYLSYPVDDEPSRQLRAFTRTSVLSPGEREVVVLRLSKKDSSIFDVGTQQWLVPTASSKCTSDPHRETSDCQARS